MNALRRYLPEIDLEKPIPIELLEKMEVTLDDFKNAHRGIEPSALREFFIEIPKISWEDVGGLEDIKQSLKEAVEWPLSQPEVFKRMGIHAPRGFYCMVLRVLGKLFSQKLLRMNPKRISSLLKDLKC